MTAKILDGNAIAKKIRQEVAASVKNLRENRNIQPNLTVILIGDNPASALYVRLKKRDCEKTGVDCRVTRLPAELTTADLIDVIEKLNQDDAVHGILLQLPLPDHN